jgi:hypothetical protein
VITKDQLDSLDFALGQLIAKMHVHGRTKNLLLYGEPRIGKSSYILQVLEELAEKLPDLYGPRDKALLVQLAKVRNIPDPEKNWWRVFLVFKPEQFIQLIQFLLATNITAIMIMWDDAGLWMFALDWNDPRIKGAMKFMQVSGTVCSGLVLTTPALGMVLKKITQLEGILIGKVVKRTGSDRGWALRKAKLYKNILQPWGKRYNPPELEDDFNVMLATELYRWYDPIRRAYVKEALDLLAKGYGIKLQSVDELLAMLQAGGLAPAAPIPADV